MIDIIGRLSISSPSFRNDHQGLDITGVRLRSTRFYRLSDVDWVVKFGDTPIIKILHARLDDGDLIPTYDPVRERKGRWNGLHLHLETVTDAARGLSPLIFTEINGNRMFKFKHLNSRIGIFFVYPEFIEEWQSDKLKSKLCGKRDFLRYFMALMAWEGRHAIDKGVHRTFGYESSLWKKKFFISDYITAAILMKDYLRAAYHSKSNLPFLRKLDVFFQYGTGVNPTTMAVHQSNRYHERVSFFRKHVGGPAWL